MNNIRKLTRTLLLGVGALGLAACAAGLPTQVSRYQAMPVPAGQTFYVVPAEGGQPTLEFNRYAALVAQHLQAKGYTPAGAPQLANMVVRWIWRRRRHRERRSIRRALELRLRLADRSTAALRPVTAG